MKDNPYQKLYHKAHLMNPNGGVSALCFKTPRAIDLRKGLWTLIRWPGSGFETLEFQKLFPDVHAWMRERD